MDHSKFKLSEEAAEDQMQAFMDYYDLDLSIIQQDEVREGLQSSVAKIQRAVRMGKIEINTDSDIKVTQHLKNGDTLEYAEISGRNKVEMKNAKTTDHHGKVYALLGSLAGVGDAAIRKLKGADLGIAECLGSLYLQV